MMRRISRRDFIARAGSCAGHLALAAAAGGPLLRRAWAGPARGRVVAREPFGYLEEVAEGVWALISTPLDGDRTTLANGGLVAGSEGVLAVEGFYEPEGARWLAGKSRELTGRWPTHVVVTHYHADHVRGLAGYSGEDAPGGVLATAVTRDLVLDPEREPDPSLAAALREAQVLSPGEETALDLGGRSVRIVPRAGHTASDLTVELEDPAVVFDGDLVWNGMFPNYVDADPVRLRSAVRALPGGPATVHVPGHGAVAASADLERYAAMLDEVETAARRAHSAGLGAAEAAAGFELPAALGEWVLFGRPFFERAFAAWYRALEG